jgi:hypothetical protein
MLRARVETVLSVLFAIGTAATLVWPTWLETLTGLEPDQGTGESEWWLVLLLGAAALVTAALARRDYRAARSRPGATSG